MSVRDSIRRATVQSNGGRCDCPACIETHRQIDEKYRAHRDEIDARYRARAAKIMENVDAIVAEVGAFRAKRGAGT